ncbi:CPBP family intramembrane metalloprotease [Aldersonia sp. NBC_00410]|uniref:CPBP family intramembrane glutamic endopeptidase n=1 Tax=Aldersonia sp. NBC_00410 TaxID=2975954 RepID=UPI00225535FF|nr:CPBP family intramembrane glutamic endopeptidase [Aldersonia sp. NBC_00410]MCX5045591.1 CPBP family intramembrane metalloprotease [Aldersonia sp. NBC_00410]
MDAARWHRWAGLAAVLGAILAINLLAHFLDEPAQSFVVPVGALALVAAARLCGLSWTELGLGRSTAGRGPRYAAAIVGLIAVAVAVGVALPLTRSLFRNEAYDSIGPALFAALVIIPLVTAVPEELIFRGVLLGTWLRVARPQIAIAGSAVTFGLWHVLSSLGLAASNAGMSDRLGGDTGAQVLGVLGAVVATTAAGLVFGWLRWYTGNLLAGVALHWALNGFGAIGAALAWQLS